MDAVAAAGPAELSGGAICQAKRWLPGACGPARRHRLFILALAAAAELRVAALLGFWPAMLIRLDSYDYLWGAVRLSPNVVNTSGYSLFLWLLRPAGSLALVTALQHVMGLAIAIMVYGLLRRYRLPAWGATLAAAPVLFLPAQLVLEQHISPDVLATFLMVAALTVLLARPAPGWRRLAAAGLLAGAAAITWPITLPLILLMPCFLLARRAGWRRAGAAALAGLVPVLGYMGWFAAATGTLSLSDSSGLFLWARTMSFANCAVIRPPAGLRALCPATAPGRPGGLSPSGQPGPRDYLWNHRDWLWQQAAPRQFAPDTGAFTPAANAKAMRFAIMAITAQPGAYARLVARQMLQPFISADTAQATAPAGQLRFPVTQPRTVAAAELPAADVRYALGAIKAYTGNTQGLAADLSDIATRVRSPCASVLQSYQRLISLPGPIFGLIIATGLAGLLIPRRRSAAAALAWASAIAVLMLPVMMHSYAYRFVISVLPIACIAAALPFRGAGAGKSSAAQAGARAVPRE